MNFGYSARIPSTAIPRHVRRQPGAGAAIAEGVGALAQTVSRVSYQDAQVQEQVAESEARIEEIETRRWRSSTGATLLTDYADLQTQIDARMEEVRKSAPPGAPEHEAAAREAVDAVVSPFLERIPDDPELQERFRPLVANLTARTVLGERNWQQQTSAKHIAQSWEKWETTASGRLYADPTGEGFAGFIAEGEAAIAVTDVDETTKAAMREQLHAVGTRSLFTGLIDSGRQDVVRKAIEGGQFDGLLDDKQKSNWLGQVRQADRIAASEAEAAAAQARREALEQGKQVQVRIKNGDDVSTAEAQAAYVAMQQAGVPESDLLEFGFMVEEATISQSLRGYGTPELQAQRDALQRKVDAGKATAAEERTLGLMDDHLEGRTTKQADELGDLWKGSTEERLQALAQARNLPPDQRLAATARVSPSMQLMVQFSPRNQALAVQGAAIRADRPDDFLPKAEGRSKGGEDAAREVMRQYLGDTINDIGGITDDMMNVALDLMAGFRTANKRETGWHRGDFLAAMRAVTGGTQRSDGTWQGGIGTVEGFRIELPSNKSEQEFAREYARHDFAGATYADGSAAAKGDIRRHFRPVFYRTAEDGRAVYVLQGQDGLLMKGNRPYYLTYGSAR